MDESNHDRVKALLADLRRSKVNPGAASIAADYIHVLYDLLVAEARCACCEEDDICSDECTFTDDCPDEAERMEFVREMLRLPS